MTGAGPDRDPLDTPAFDPERIAALRRDLVAARFTVDRLAERWGEVADDALNRGDRVPAQRALADGDASEPLAVLARLFVLGEVLDGALVDSALPALGIDGASALRVVESAGLGSVRASIDLRPYTLVDAGGVASWWIASDLGEVATGGELRIDHVLGVGAASVTLSGVLLQDPVGTVVDLGTGSGIQALHASRLARRVIATDVSRRALDFARFTAELCGVRSIEFRHGDLWGPLRGDTVDRIVSNPPFVITPRAAAVPQYEYRDGGRTGDDLLRDVVTGCARHLVPGGVAQLLGNWEYSPATPGVDGPDRVAAWARVVGLDWWIVERDSVDPARYAETWIRDGGTRPGTARYESLVRAWLDDFAARGVRRIGFGLILLRRPSLDSPVPPLRRVERLFGPIGASAGLGWHIAECLRARDRISVLDDEELGALTFRVAPDVTEERSHRPGEEHPTVIRLRQGAGFAREVPASTALAAVVGACDGELSLAVIVAAVADLLSVPESELLRELLPEIRELVVGGMLLPSEG